MVTKKLVPTSITLNITIIHNIMYSVRKARLSKLGIRREVIRLKERTREIMLPRISRKRRLWNDSDVMKKVPRASRPGDTRNGKNDESGSDDDLVVPSFWIQTGRVKRKRGTAVRGTKRHHQTEMTIKLRQHQQTSSPASDIIRHRRRFRKGPQRRLEQRRSMCQS